MKIVQITPGLLPIPPNGWGAVEKIIWEYHNNALKLGYFSDIKYLDEVVKDDYSIVHVHVANLALKCYERGIPYIFSMHDHHAYLYGKTSPVYEENKEALSKSLIGIVPAKYLVEYFDLPNVTYLSHGVNIDYFGNTKDIFIGEHKILCVANNGYIHDQSRDRKGFSFAIDAARRLDLPITVCGPENNKKYFEKNPCDYHKLSIKYNLTEDELRNEYRSHSIFIHASELEAGHPNLTILEAMASGLPVITTTEENQETTSLIPITRNTEEIVLAIEKVVSDYSRYSTQSSSFAASNYDWLKITQKLLNLYMGCSCDIMKKSLIHSYQKTEIKIRKKREPENTFHYSFIDGPKCEILGPKEKEYSVNFIDSERGEVVFSTSIKNNCWASASKKYFVKWLIEVYDGETLVNSHTFDLKDKKVYIHIDSKALGDTIAWFPYIEEFRKIHGCKVVCSTFWNSLFKNSYPHLEFTNPGGSVSGLYAMYNIGWYYFQDGLLDLGKHRKDVKKIPLQQTSSDILGITFKEIRPLIDRPTERRYVLGNYVSIAPHASSHAKYWNREGGWQNLIDWFKTKGLNCAMITHEPLGDKWHDSKLGGKLDGVIDRTGDFPIENRINEIAHSKLYVGVSSGLSWLAWALEKPVVLISGFTEEFLEPRSVVRIINKDVCHGCQTEFKLDPGDWEWCPRKKGTDEQFICTKSISSESVISEIGRQIELDI
jgi:autotransporter strand-loop-strand O-heptosyltransferase